MSYHHFSANERHTLMYLLHMRLSYREIGRRLGRHHSTISREVKRNGRRFACYWDEPAHRWAMERRQKARHTRKRCNSKLVCYVMDKLTQDWSPQTIAQRLKMDHPRSTRLRISHESIYRWIYADAARGGTLYQHLLRRHKRRRRQFKYGTGRGLIPNRVSIHDRPKSIENRVRFGHWEGDTVEGKKSTGGIATHVERKSRLLIAGKLKDKCADTFAQVTSEIFEAIPGKLRKTLTVDNGKEFSQFKKIEEATGMAVFFADPYAPWQRGTNENTNGLLRHYFPKGIDWRKVTDEMLASAVEKLNNRPRKCLGYRTPNEVFFGLMNGWRT
ncbi:MAG: IS30 family transposase [Sedimenticola thiotaurini]|uniref:IS30 family transposase n=1 Tax=Sedimenticola thiotaurini TaxID=1543721 RepID=A0A558CPP2_9GAMM|nr:MAG: IS30 family transposase [Sedimenticola thiotaurini]